jgi:hypothetical protein
MVSNLWWNSLSYVGWRIRLGFVDGGMLLIAGFGTSSVVGGVGVKQLPDKYLARSGDFCHFWTGFTAPALHVQRVIGSSWWDYGGAK